MGRTVLHPMKLRRLEEGLSQPALAEVLRVSVSTIRNIESGKSSGSLKVRARAAHFFGCSLDELTDPREAE